MGETAFLDYLVGRGLGPQTRTRYLRFVREAQAWLAERGTSLAEAPAILIDEYAEACVADSHSSRAQCAAAFSHYWTMIDRRRAPRGAVRVPPSPEMVCRAIEPAKADRLVEMSLGWYPKGTAVLVGLGLALRRFEIAKVERSRFSDDYAWYTVTGKYSKTRTLPVHPVLVRELESFDWGPWLFPGRLHDHVNPATIGSWVAEVGAKAGIVNLKPHELRHTSLATAHDELPNLRAVMQFARHSKPSTTVGYTRTTAEQLREVSRSLTFFRDLIELPATGTDG